MNALLTQLREKHLRGEIGGLFAVCSAHPLVLRSAFEMALERDRPLLIEATANQVNSFSGYSGMTPFDFAAVITRLADGLGMSQSQFIIGADHLGPHAWKHETASAAMEKAAILARQCVRAGFRKIHLDTVQGCADDPLPQLSLEETAQRAVKLCRAAEAAADKQPRRPAPFYVIGNEVPPPGGGLEEDSHLIVTDPDHLKQTLDVYENAFHAAGMASVWPRVMAVVVQPGAEFGDHGISAYQPERAAALSAAHARLPGIMTYEIHATDYQSPAALRQMVRDHFPLLKVGPCLTFALRKTLYALARLEAALNGQENPSHLPRVMERLMRAHPRHWQSHYKGTPEALFDLRHNSLRDRIRYYWSYPEARQAVDRLIRNLRRPIAHSLLAAHLPDLYARNARIRNPEQPFDPEAAIKAGIRLALEPYAAACWDP